MLEIIALTAVLWSCDDERVIEDYPELCTIEGAVESSGEPRQWHYWLT